MNDSDSAAAGRPFSPATPTSDSARPGDPSPASVPPDPAARHRMGFDGRRAEIGKIAASNSLLTLATLGVYRFWGKARIRRYLWSRIRFLGDRVEYTGTGGELFLGFLAAIAVLALVAGGLFGIRMALGEAHPGYWWFLESVYVLALFLLSHAAAYRARRYRLSRTEWRGIRFAQGGPSIRYAFAALGWSVVVLLSLGAAYAVYRTRLQGYRTAHTSFGNRRFVLDARARELLGTWLLAWLLLVPSLGITYVWYRTKEFRHFTRKTRCGALRFESALAARPIILIVLAYSLLMLLAVGLLIGAVTALAVVVLPAWSGPLETIAGTLPYELGPVDLVTHIAVIAVFFPVMGVLRAVFLMHPLFREVSGSLHVVGNEDYALIAQSRAAMPRRGEGLADALDVGAV